MYTPTEIRAAIEEVERSYYLPSTAEVNPRITLVVKMLRATLPTCTTCGGDGKCQACGGSGEPTTNRDPRRDLTCSCDPCRRRRLDNPVGTC